MKTVLQEIALYNLKADQALCGILGELSDEVLDRETGTWYRTIRGTMEHITLSFLLWLKRYDGMFGYPCLKGHPLIRTDINRIKAGLYEDPRRFLALADETDRLVRDFAGELKEEDLNLLIRYKNIKGEELERTFWKTVFHVLNHAVHHRGEISAMLDQQKIANDFSGFTAYTV